MDNKLLIGIAGRTASGKSAIARTLLNHFKPSTCAVIKVDSYYHDLKHLPMSEREKNNFDDPKSIDFDLQDSSKEEIIRLLSSDGKLIKRPFLVYEEKNIILGFNESEYTNHLE